MFILSLSAQAEFSATQIVTLEPNSITIYTSVIEYSIGDNLFISLVADKHPILGLAIDFSTSKYFQPFSKILYTTVGVRKRIRDGPFDLTPYITISYRI